MNKVEKEDVQAIMNVIDREAFRGTTTLVTGATGSLARYIVHSLMELFHTTEDRNGRVIVLSRSHKKIEDAFFDYLNDKQFQIIEGSVENLTCDQIEGSLDYIFHAACNSSTAYFSTNPTEILSANVIGTYQLLELARIKRIRGFLFFSSGAAYGGANVWGSYSGVDPTAPHNCYVIGKQAGENFCSAFFHEYGVPTKIVRIAYTYGPHIDLNDGHLYSDLIKSVIDYKDIYIKGNPKKYMRLLYVTDAVRAFFLIMQNGEEMVPYEVYNLTEVMTIEDIAKMLTEVTFKERGLRYRKKTDGVEDELIKVFPENIAKLNLKPHISLSEGMKRSVMSIELNSIHGSM